MIGNKAFGAKPAPSGRQIDVGVLASERAEEPPQVLELVGEGVKAR